MDLPGTTTEALFETFRSWSINGEPAGHMDAYLADSFCRFVHTLELVGPNSTGRCLEIGANPYFTTHLLAQFTALDLTLINFYGDHGRGTRTTEQLSYASPGVVETTLALDSDLLNVEEDALPHPDGAFDVVLFCEVLEHLLMDPLAVLREIHRVLRPNGALVLSTPKDRKSVV